MSQIKVKLASQTDEPAEAKKVIHLKQLNPKLKQAMIKNLFKQFPEQPTPTKVLKITRLKAPKQLQSQPEQKQ